MVPVLFSFGSLHVYSLSVALVLAWFIFSFLFWRALRNQGVGEDHIFDLTFYSSLTAIIGSRLWFVATNWDMFSGHIIRIAAPWIAPGLSLYGALVPGMVTLIFLSRQYKVRVGYVLDAFGYAFPAAFIIGAIGALLDGSYIGLKANLPWSIFYVGHEGARHPIQMYEIITVSFILLGIFFLGRKAKSKKWPYGVLGLWFFTMFTISMFALEFFKDTSVYLGYLRANQWILVGLFAETMGAFYVRGGAKEVVRPYINKLIGGLHAKFPKRSS